VVWLRGGATPDSCEMAGGKFADALLTFSGDKTNTFRDRHHQCCGLRDGPLPERGLGLRPFHNRLSRLHMTAARRAAAFVFAAGTQWI
jgi:hypothetical protein